MEKEDMVCIDRIAQSPRGDTTLSAFYDFFFLYKEKKHRGTVHSYTLGCVVENGYRRQTLNTERQVRGLPCEAMAGGN